MANKNNNTQLPASYQTPLMLALEQVLIEDEIFFIDVIKDFWNPELVRADLLPYLALYLGVIEWDSTWDINQKRAVCQNALLVNKRRGTLASLKEALKSLKLKATVVEWWENPNLEKGTAVINFHEDDIIYSRDQYKVIYRLVNEVKRLTLLLSFKKTTSIARDFCIAGIVIIVKRVYV